MAIFSKETTNHKDIAEFKGSETMIGKGAVLTGDTETYGTMRVDGRIIGNVTSKSRTVIGASGYLEGNIIAENATIEGEVKGSVTIQDTLTLKSTAVVTGDIVCNKLIIEGGAIFNGSCKMGDSIKNIELNHTAKAAFEKSNAKVNATEA